MRYLLIAICLICLATFGMAEVPAELDKTSVSDFLTPDGRFDIEAARQAGFDGSLDVEGFDITLDPTTGAPQLIPQADSDDQYWHSMSVPDSGMDGNVHSLLVYKGDLIVGGSFTNASGVAVNHIARWDGSIWQSLGIGMNGAVRSLSIYRNKLIAGGEFTMAGGVAANFIALWDGLAW